MRNHGGVQCKGHPAHYRRPRTAWNSGTARAAATARRFRRHRKNGGLVVKTESDGRLAAVLDKRGLLEVRKVSPA